MVHLQRDTVLCWNSRTVDHDDSGKLALFKDVFKPAMTPQILAIVLNQWPQVPRTFSACKRNNGENESKQRPPRQHCVQYAKHYNITYCLKCAWLSHTHTHTHTHTLFYVDAVERPHVCIDTSSQSFQLVTQQTRPYISLRIASRQFASLVHRR